MKRKLSILVALCVIVLACVWGYRQTAVVGTISGAELQTITLDGSTYVLDGENDFHAEDQGAFVGVVSNGRDRCRVYWVKGDPDHQYLYRLWGYDGAFYKRVP